MNKAELSDWDVPRPTLRLCLTLGLGALGAALFHGRNNWYLPLPIASNHQAAASIIWLAAALACVGVLRLCEQEKVRWRRPCFADLLRVPAIALAAPLLLFAARPRRGNQSESSRMQIFSRVAFAVFPYAFAGGIAPGLLGGDTLRSIRPVVDAWFSLWLWSWLGCALLFLLSPWPVYPRILPPGQCKVERIFGMWGTLVFGAMILAMLCVTRSPFSPPFLGLMLIAIFCFCAMLSMVSPWPAFISFPKLGELPAECKLPVLGTILLLTMALLPLTAFGLKSFLEVASGRIFADLAGYRVAGGLIAFTYSAFFLVPYVAVVRWLSDRRTPLGYWAFTDATIIMFILLFSFLTISITKLSHYALAGQLNYERTCGLIYALVASVGSLVFLAWAIWPPSQEEEL